MAIRERGGTSTQGTSANPVLAARELGVETDTGRMKVGDGVTAWNQLPYSQGLNVNEASSLRMRAPDGGLWDFTAANDGIPITTPAPTTDPIGTIDSIRLTAPAGSIWSYTVANDGVLTYAIVPV